MEGYKRLLAAGALWAFSVAVVVVDMLEPDAPRGLGALGAVFGLVALLPSMDLIVERRLDEHRIRVQEILAFVEAERARDLPRIR